MHVADGMYVIDSDHEAGAVPLPSPPPEPIVQREFGLAHNTRIER